MTVALAPGTTDYEMTSERELTYTRAFAAPRALVFSAFTEAEHLRNWMGPQEGGMKTPEHDFSVGGKYRWEFYGDAGELQVTISGMFTEITPGEYVVHTEKMEFGDVVTPEYPTSLAFSEEAGLTIVVGKILFPDADAAKAAGESGMKGGMDIGFNRLDGVLASR